MLRGRRSAVLSTFTAHTQTSASIRMTWPLMRTVVCSGRPQGGHCLEATSLLLHCLTLSHKYYCDWSDLHFLFLFYSFNYNQKNLLFHINNTTNIRHTCCIIFL